MFITFEGHDGSGKTTQARLLAAWLRARGHEVVETREPGGTPFGETIRELVLHGDPMGAWAEAALFAASRAEHVESLIRPALERGAWVISDRYIDSSLVYQGIGRGLGIDAVLQLNRAVTGGLEPARTFLLLLEPGVRGGRLGDELDRIEREDAGFQHAVTDAYRELVERFPERIVALDGGQSVETIAEQVRDHVRA